ncbi:MAG: PH domain-containing protein [Bryobacteraceae bacterium]
MKLQPSLKFVKLAYVLCLLMAVALAVWIFEGVNHPDWAVYLFIVPGVLAFFAIIRHIKRRMASVTIAGDRLRYESGLFSKTTRTIEIEKVQDVRVDQSFGQRMVNLGNLSVETAGGTSRMEIDSIDNPHVAADHILALARTQRERRPENEPPGTPHL